MANVFEKILNNKWKELMFKISSKRSIGTRFCAAVEYLPYVHVPLEK